MTLIKILKTAFKAVKQLKKPTIWALVYEFSLIIVSQLTKQYKIMTPLLKLFRIFKIWTITTMIFSFIYSGFAEIFHFSYDYRVIIAILFGLGLLAKEFVFEYFDIYSYISKLLEKITDKLQNKVIETDNKGKIINQNTVDKITPSRDSQMLPHRNDIHHRTVYRPIKFEDIPHTPVKTVYTDYVHNEQSMWTDWKFYGLAISLGLGLYCLGVYYDYLPSPSFTGTWDYIKSCSHDAFTNVKDYFLGRDRDGGSPTNTSINNMDTNGGSVTPKASSSTSSMNFKDKNDVTSQIFESSSNQSTPKGKAKDLELANLSLIDLTPDEKDKFQLAYLSLMEDLCTKGIDLYKYPVEWVHLTGTELVDFLQLKNKVIGEFVYFLTQFSSISLHLGSNYRNIISPADVAYLDNLMELYMTNLAEFTDKYSITPIPNLSDLFDITLIICNIETIPPIIDYALSHRIDEILAPHIQSFSILFCTFDRIKAFFRKLPFFKPKQEYVIIKHDLPQLEYACLNKDVLDFFSLDEYHTYTKGIEFSWINTEAYQPNYKYPNFDAWKNDILSKLLIYMHNHAIIAELNLKDKDLTRNDHKYLFEMELFFDHELFELLCYTNIEFEKYYMDYYTLCLFTRIALDERYELNNSYNNYKPYTLTTKDIYKPSKIMKLLLDNSKP